MPGTVNRNTVVSNGTVFGLWPLGRFIAVVGLTLLVIFVVMQPEASRGMGLMDRTLFWTINVGLALASLYAASWLVLPYVINRVPAWVALLLAGLAAAVIMAPVGYLIEQVLPESLQTFEDDSWGDRLEQIGFWPGLLGEFIEILPELLAIWMVINLPFLTSKPRLNEPPGPAGNAGPDQPQDVEKGEAGQYAEDVRNEFLSSLPDALGRNVLAISSDLHYLHVYTDKGRCMILGSLQGAADALGEEGMRVHRSHWVARRAIVKIIKDGQQWYCLLSNDLKVPISRRKKSTVAGWFGHSTRITPISSRKRKSS